MEGSRAVSVMEKVASDLKQALREKDELTKRVLRSVKTAVQYRQLEKGSELTDGEVHEVVQKEVRQRRDSMASVPEGQREKYKEYLDEQQREIAVLERYLPAPLGDAELSSLIGRLLDEHGIRAKSQMGEAMRLVMPHVKGRADGRRVNQLVAERLK